MNVRLPQARANTSMRPSPYDTAAGVPSRSPPRSSQPLQVTATRPGSCHDEPGSGEAGFDAFVTRSPDLLDKRLLTRLYRGGTLASVAARDGWVEPDRRPVPGR